jgi:hypothetical protein
MLISDLKEYFKKSAPGKSYTKKPFCLGTWDFLDKSFPG